MIRRWLVLFADEALFAANRSLEGALKALITESTLALEGKGLPIIQVPNRLSIIMATNADWAIPAGIAERRFLVLDVAEGKQGDRAYFDALQRQMKNGGAAAMLHDLLQLDIEAYCRQHGIDLRLPPRTAALVDQVIMSLPSPLKWWHHCLTVGEIIPWHCEHSESGVEADHLQPWPTFVATQLLFDQYIEFCRSTRESYPVGIAQFGRNMVLVGLKASRPRKKVPIREDKSTHGEWTLITRERQCGYRVLTLKASREAFDRKIGVSASWPSLEPDS